MRGLKNSYVSMVGWGLLLAGALSFASCSGDETIDDIAIQGKAITFGNASIGNTSRAYDPSYGEGNDITSFQVWGTVTGNTSNTVNVFNGATVTKGNVAYGQPWTCDQTQYWIPSATYKFMAIAHGTVEPSSLNSNGMPTAISYTADGTTDLLLGEVATNGIKTVTTDVNCTPTENPVAFTMSHLLSKVHFTFQTTSAGSFNVADIAVSRHFASGQYTIADGTWGSQVEATTALSFGGTTSVTASAPTSTDARLIIPGTQNLSVSFSKTYILNGKEMNTEPVTASLNDLTFEGNKEYNILVTLEGGSEITFIIESLKGWDTDENGNSKDQQDIEVDL